MARNKDGSPVARSGSARPDRVPRARLRDHRDRGREAEDAALHAGAVPLAAADAAGVVERVGEIAGLAHGMRVLTLVPLPAGVADGSGIACHDATR